MLIDKTTGICNQLTTTVDMAVRLRQLLKDKGWYSGSREYPIEHPTELISPKDAYWGALPDLWDENCPYCQRRIAIYKELIACSVNEK